MTPAHQISGVEGACTGLMDVFYAQRVCPVGKPCGWPNCVSPQRRACVYDAIFFGKNVCKVNMLLLPCLCTANSGLVLLHNWPTIGRRRCCARFPYRWDGEHAEGIRDHARLWKAIRPPLRCACGRHWQGESRDDNSGRYPRAYRSAQQCAHPGTAALSPGSSASAAPWPCAMR